MSVAHSTKARSKAPAKPAAHWLAIATLTVFGALLLSRGLSPPYSPNNTSRHPSVAAATSCERYETRPIRDIRTGHRVMADNPELHGQQVEEPEIDPATWRNVVLQMSKDDGGMLHIVLLRPLDWIAEHGAQPDGTIDLDLDEFGAAGLAQVLSIDRCPPVEDGPGRLVTSTFAHSSAEILDICVKGLREPIGTTASHPWWSADRQAFVAAGQLQIGEQLLLADGSRTAVATITPRSTPEPVYNLEVDGEHVYYVSSNGVLVHNTCTNFHGYAIYNRLTGEVLKFGVSRGNFTKRTSESIRARAQLTKLAEKLDIPRDRLETVVLRKFTSKANMFQWERQTVGFFRQLWRQEDALPFNILPHGDPF